MSAGDRVDPLPASMLRAPEFALDDPPLDLDAIEARANAATEGPWAVWNPSHGPSHLTIGGQVAWRSTDSATSYDDDETIPHWADGNFMAHARTDVPALVAAVRDLRDEVATANRVLDGTGAALSECRDDYRALRAERDRLQDALDRVKALCGEQAEARRAEAEDYSAWISHPGVGDRYTGPRPLGADRFEAAVLAALTTPTEDNDE